MAPFCLDILSAGPCLYSGSYRLPESVVGFLGRNVQEFGTEARALGARMRAGTVDDPELALGLFLTQLAFVSSRFGDPLDWFTLSGFYDDETLGVVRAIGRERAWPEPPAPLSVEIALSDSEQLSPDEALLLLHGVRWEACIPRPFLAPPEAEPTRRDRVIDALQHGAPLDDDDLTLAIHITELVFAGEAFGLGCRWSSSTGLADSSALATLRLLQRRHRKCLCARRPPGRSLLGRIRRERQTSDR